MFCHPLARGEAGLALGWKGVEEQGSKRSVLPLLPQPGVGIVLSASSSLRERKSSLGIFEGHSEMGFKAGSLAVVFPAVLYQKIPWV